MEVDFTFLGVAITGRGVLSTAGGILECNLTGTGTISVAGCDACPELSGVVRLYQPVGGDLTLTQSLTYNFLGIALAGTAIFTRYRTVESFSFSGTLDSSFADGLKSNLIAAVLATTNNEENVFVRALNAAFGTVSADALRMKYSGGAFVECEIDIVLVDQPRTLAFKLIRIPTSRLDLFTLIGQLGAEILPLLSPLEGTVSLPQRDSDSICGPAIPCLCGPELGCSSRLRRVSEELRKIANGTDSTLVPYVPVALTNRLRFDGVPLAMNLSVDMAPQRREHRARMLDRCPLSDVYLKLTGCCGDRICARPKLRVTGSVGIKIRGEIAYVVAEGSLKLEAPGQGLSPIDKSFQAETAFLSNIINSLSSSIDSTATALLSASSLCDVVPGLRDTVIGGIGGGSTEACALGKCITINFPRTDGIKLYDILPCQRMIL